MTDLIDTTSRIMAFGLAILLSSAALATAIVPASPAGILA